LLIAFGSAYHCAKMPNATRYSHQLHLILARPALKSLYRCFEITRVLVRLDHAASVIVNANHSIM
jgi:hypothetical protein